MNGNVPTFNEAPSIEVVRDFWTKIEGSVGKVNKYDQGVKDWQKETKKRVGRTSPVEPNSIDDTKLRKALKKAKSWSALGHIASTFFGGKHSPLHSLPWQMYYGGWRVEICQSHTGLQGVVLYSSPKKGPEECGQLLTYSVPQRKVQRCHSIHYIRRF